ncbi:MAG: hypothetical protein NTY02_15420, partial [Acidobacteria bacterium]|nr:hypothetical protein [Acidobacteriota bacterium]
VMPVAAAPGAGPRALAHQHVWLLVSSRDTCQVCPSIVKDEIVRIWRLNGVEITYLDNSSGGTSPTQNRRSIVASIIGSREDLPARFRATVSPRAFGVTLTSGGVPVPVTYAFAGPALRLVRRAQQATSGVQELWLCQLLGRIVAHEIGHVLLRSGAHSDNGLMRPTFDLTDLMPGRDGAYMLRAEDRAAVQAFLSGVTQEDTVRLADVSPLK